MTYSPQFKCQYCGVMLTSSISGDTGLLTLCGCPEARAAWEKYNREAVEARKKARTRKKR
jgi:hypothetical protein